MNPRRREELSDVTFEARLVVPSVLRTEQTKGTESLVSRLDRQRVTDF